MKTKKTKKTRKIDKSLNRIVVVGHIQPAGRGDLTER